MTITEYLDSQVPEKKRLLSSIHEIIMKVDEVDPKVGPMMGKELLIYNCNKYFKYALGNTKNYMTLHLMPIYCNTDLHAKYSKLLPKAKFQKGCINFGSAEEMPLSIVAELIAECAKIDMAQIMAKFKKK